MNSSKLYSVTTIKQCLFILLFSFPVLPLKLTNIVFIVFSILVLYHALKEKPKLLFSDYKWYAMFVIVFVPYFIELLLYPSNAVIRFETEKKLMFLVVPLAFYLNSILTVKPDIKKALSCFVLSVSALSVVCIFYLLFKIPLLAQTTYQNGAFELRTSFEEFSKLHPTYYGLFSTSACLWVIYYFNQYSKKYKIILSICLFFLLLLNIVIAAKAPLMILVLGLAWIAYKKTPNKVRLLMIYGFSLIALTVIIIAVPSLRSRIAEVSGFFINASATNTVLERYVVFNCSKMVFAQDFYTGIGSRNTQSLLDFCYIYFKFYKGYTIHLNSHNQYLTFGISYGIAFMLAFIGILILIFKKLKNDPLSVIFWMSSILIMLTESILERQMGIYYFLFFGLLFITNTYIKKTTIANPK